MASAYAGDATSSVPGADRLDSAALCTAVCAAGIAAATSPLLATVDNHTAVYDIEAHVVYLPNGERMEAHSGLGEWIDDPGHVKCQVHGATPPNVYNLVMREGLVPRRRGASPHSRRRQQHVWPRRHPGASLHARPERPVVRLRVVQGLPSVPAAPSSGARSTASWSCRISTEGGRPRSTPAATAPIATPSTNCPRRRG